MYNGEYSIIDYPPPRTELYHKSLRKCDKLHTLLESMLEEENRHMVKDLLDAFGDMYSEECKQAYSDGFSIDTKLIIKAIWGE